MSWTELVHLSWNGAISLPQWMGRTAIRPFIMIQYPRVRIQLLFLLKLIQANLRRNLRQSSVPRIPLQASHHPHRRKSSTRNGLAESSISEVKSLISSHPLSLHEENPNHLASISSRLNRSFLRHPLDHQLQIKARRLFNELALLQPYRVVSAEDTVATPPNSHPPESKVTPRIRLRHLSTSIPSGVDVRSAYQLLCMSHLRLIELEMPRTSGRVWKLCATKLETSGFGC